MKVWQKVLFEKNYPYLRIKYKKIINKLNINMLSRLSMLMLPS